MVLMKMVEMLYRSDLIKQNELKNAKVTEIGKNGEKYEMVEMLNWNILHEVKHVFICGGFTQGAKNHNFRKSIVAFKAESLYLLVNMLLKLKKLKEIKLK